jgi:hypothetical protein
MNKMSDKIFFIIDQKTLFLDKMLVTFNEIPVFFVCRSQNDYYIALGIDSENEEYFLSQVSLKNLSRMLNGAITMRDLLLMGYRFWSIIAGRTVTEDVVTEIAPSNIPMADLPYEGEYLQLATKELKQYASQINNLLYSGTYIAVDDLVDISVSGDILLQCTDTITIERQVCLPEVNSKATLSIYELLIAQKSTEKCTFRQEIPIESINDPAKGFSVDICYNNNDKRIWAA